MDGILSTEDFLEDELLSLKDENKVWVLKFTRFCLYKNLDLVFPLL